MHMRIFETLFITLGVIKVRNVTAGYSQPLDTNEANSRETQIVQSCPSSGSSPLQVYPGIIEIERVGENEVCTLTKIYIDEDKNVSKSVPIARSYDNNDWEISPGQFAMSIFDHQPLCSSSSCRIDLPSLEANEEYRLTNYENTLSARDEFARFLESATFGVTTQDLDILEESDGDSFSVISSWVETQMNEVSTPRTSHRKFWRERVNSRVSTLFRKRIPRLSFFLINCNQTAPYGCSGWDTRPPVLKEFKVAKLCICQK